MVTTRFGWSEQFLSSNNGLGVDETDDGISLHSELNDNNRKPQAYGEQMIRPSGEKHTSLINPWPTFNSSQ